MNVKIVFTLFAICVMAFGQLTGFVNRIDQWLMGHSPSESVVGANETVTFGFGLPPVMAEVASAEVPELIPVDPNANPLFASILIDRLNVREIRFTAAYNGIPDNGYVPMIYTFDPDNCIGCADPADVLTYPINHMHVVRGNSSTAGVVQYVLKLDDAYCEAIPRTNRFKVILADARPYLAGQDSIADDVTVIPFDQAWCQ